MNTPVNIEIEKLLLEKSIDMPVTTTIAEVVMWLLKKHHIWIFIQPQSLIGLYRHREADNWYYTIIHCDRVNSNYYNSPTEAYEAAIEYCLTKLV